jgi:SAM-dependent methyltransferase
MAVGQRVASPVLGLASVKATPAGRATKWLFTVTAFLGAGLLFLVEPLVAKLLLPSYGGSATVWSTCTLFFQTLLLLAYGYCHWSTSRLGRPWQPRAHLLLLLLPVLVLPLAVPADAAPPLGAMPAVWLIRTLALLIGLPFVVVATTGPLLQRWYSWTSGPRADDPYFLFAASNLGSFVGLLAYPLWVEPRLTLAEQRASWSIAYVVFLALTAACALAAARPRPEAPVAVPAPRSDLVRPTTRRMLVWALLAMLPSTLMLSVTTHLSTDVASIPLLWIVPLALYLGSFVLAFARRSRAIPVTATRVAVALGLVEVVVALSGPALPIYVSITTSLLMLATVSYAAHARLAVDRPDATQLTLFYLVVAAGGVLGGLLNGFVAPAVFSSVLEYPIGLSAVPLLLVGVVALRRGRLSLQMRTNLVRATFIAVLVCPVVLALRTGITLQASRIFVVTLLLLVTFAVGWLLAQHPSLALTAVLFLYGSNVLIGTPGLIEQTRTFYGTYRVGDNGSKHIFVHGTTVHGTQFLDPARRDVPTTYYSQQGPLGDVFAVANENGLGSVGAVGLGTGTLAAYGRPGQQFTFFELDPEVVRIAEDPAYFSYLRDSRANITTVIGDGRLSLSRAPAASFDLIVLDAFSSDAIPVHLLTEEAIESYARCLTKGGSLVFHISNRVFDLRPVLHAAAARMGWRVVLGPTNSTTPGELSSVWVVMGPANDTIRTLDHRPGWTTLGGPSVAWTDDYSSVLSVLR